MGFGKISNADGFPDMPGHAFRNQFGRFFRRRIQPFDLARILGDLHIPVSGALHLLGEQRDTVLVEERGV